MTHLCPNLYNAIFNDHIGCINILLDQGADINTKDNSSGTPLLEASYRGNKNHVKLLLDRGANLHDIDDYGDCVLHEAISGIMAGGYDIECFQLLLDSGANTNIKCAGGTTPLHRAILYGKSKCIKLLLAHGANITIKDDEGRTPFDIPCDKGQQILNEYFDSFPEKYALDDPY